MLALIGGTTTQRFPDMWIGTGGNASGLQSRFILSYSEQPQPRWKTPNDNHAIESACKQLFEAVGGSPKTLTINPSAKDAYMKWRQDDDATTDIMRRLLDQVKRFAMVIAACQNAEEIDEETMILALQFGDYQLALRAKLFPPDASSTEQAFENRVIAFLTKYGRGSAAAIQNYIKPDKLRGGFISFNRAWAALLNSGVLVKVGVSRKGEDVFNLRESPNVGTNVGNGGENLPISAATQ
jgi:hypothetical protein